MRAGSDEWGKPRSDEEHCRLRFVVSHHEDDPAKRGPSHSTGDREVYLDGVDVSIPLTESAAYDLVVDDGEGLKRVQCKYCGALRAQVDLRQIHSNSRGFVVKRVPRGAYDWLYILAADGCEYLIKECLHGRRSVDLQAAYRLGAVAESG